MKTFIFDSYFFNKEDKALILKYSYDNTLFFEEKIEFPYDGDIDDNKLMVLDNVFKYLHIACGISYYKLFVPFDIKINTFKLSKNEADFFNSFYLNGLGEFSYRNNITDIAKRINFPYENVENSANTYQLSEKYAIAIGGGKDSITSLEMLKSEIDKEKLLLISVGKALSIDKTMELSGLKYIQPKRTISKTLIELNAKLDEIGGYNGHVPISGILAFIFAACSVIYDFNTSILSNERSANVGNTQFGDRIVNHQWSKSFEFEKMFNDFCHKHMLKNFNYISFLRPLSEIHIAKIFSKFDKYHNVFTSCNKAFKINGRIENWCCDCDKCRFVFLILSVFLNKKQLTNIFGANLFDKQEQLTGFEELCGISGFKPFECVGEVKESVYAILNVNKDFENDYIIREIRKKLPTNIDVKSLENELFNINNNHLLNDKLLRILQKFL